MPSAYFPTEENDESRVFEFGADDEVVRGVGCSGVTACSSQRGGTLEKFIILIGSWLWKLLWVNGTVSYDRVRG
jgi:hypothetical protein